MKSPLSAIYHQIKSIYANLQNLDHLLNFIHYIYSKYFSGNVVKANSELSALISKMWKDDTNRLTFGRDIRLSYQNQASWSRVKDVSYNPLFSSVNSNVFNKPTFKGENLLTSSQAIYIDMIR